MSRSVPIEQRPAYVCHMSRQEFAEPHHYFFYGLLLFLIFFNVATLPDVGRIRLIVAGVLFLSFLRHSPADTALYLLAGRREVGCVLAFMALLVGSAAAAGNPDDAMTLLRNFLTSTMLMIWAFMLIRNRADIRRLTALLALTGTGQAVVNLGITMVTSSTIDRMGAVMSNSGAASMNSIGLTASWGVALAFYLFLTDARMGRKLFWATMIVFGMGAIFATGCRGAFVLVFLMVFSQFLFLRRQALNRGSTLALLIPGIAGAVYLVSLPQFEAPLNRILTVFELDPLQLEKMDTYQSRQPAARAAIAMWKDHPLAGVGTGSFIEESNAYKSLHDQRFRIGPHNMYLMLLAENGLMGLLLYALMLALIAIPLYRHERAGLGGLALYLAVAGFQEHTMHAQHILFIAAGIAAAVRAQHEGEGHYGDIGTGADRCHAGNVRRRRT